MVAVIEAVVLAVLALLGCLWFRGTPTFKAHRNQGSVPGQQGSWAQFGMYQPSRPTAPPAALRGYERPRRRWWLGRKGD
jgi:hypothetical protein